VQPPSTFPLSKRLEIPVPINAGDTVKITIVHTQSDFFVSRDGTTLDKTLPAVNSEYEADISDVFATQGTTGWCVGSGNNANMSRIRVNGVIVRDNNNVALTFTTPNPDLQLFQPGDVAQQTGGYTTATVDRIAESNAFSAADSYMQSCNISGAFGLDYNTTQGSYYSSYSGGENTVYFVLNDNEYVDGSFYARKIRAVDGDSRELMGATVYFTMPDGSKKSVQANLENSGPAGEGGQWYVVRKEDFPSNYVYQVSLLVPRGQDKTSRYPGIAFGTRGVTTEPYQLANNYVVSTDTSTNTMTVDGGQWGTGKVTGFTPVAYTGNDGTQSIKTGFSPDLVWIKDTQAEWNHKLFDTVREATKSLESNTTAAQAVEVDGLTSFDSDGFTLGTGSPVNSDTYGPYIAWCWDAGDTTVTNNDGTIESQVRSNGNFSVVSFTNGDGLVGHGLSTAPKFILTKAVDNDYSWSVYHSSLGKDRYITLNNENPAYDVAGMWGSAEPTDSVFGTSTFVAPDGYNLIAYAWAETPGVSSFGEYNGNDATTTVDCGFEPAFVLIKSTSNAVDWMLYDNQRGQEFLAPNMPQVEESSTNKQIAFTSTGFSVTGNSTSTNGVNNTYIYAAFAGNSTGESQVTGQPLVATANDVDYLDGNTLGVSDVSGSWRVGLNAQGAEVTSYAPSPESIVFTSMNGGTTPFTGTDATLTSRTWTLEKGNSATGPWTEVGTYVDYAANESQDGATPWDNPALEPNKFYQVKVEYDSNNAVAVESTFNTFKTGDA
jgi:hypothetical protein